MITNASPTPATLASFLPLVGHVVTQLAPRLPRRVDRRGVWTAAAWGLVAASDEMRVDDPRFSATALRMALARAVSGAVDAEPVGNDDALAAAFGLPLTQLRALRDAVAGPEDAPVVQDAAGALVGAL